MQLFKSNRTDVFKRGMSPNPVIETLYKLEDGLSGLYARLKECEIHALTLECSKERLHSSIIPTVAFTAHTHCDATVSKQSLIGCAGVLASPVRMVQEASLWTTQEQSHA